MPTNFIVVILNIEIIASPCQLLEQCTEKLELCGAARRVFLPGGNEVFMPQEIPRDAEVYISMGEPFKDPYRCTKSESPFAHSHF